MKAFTFGDRRMKRAVCPALLLLFCGTLLAVPPSLRYHDLGWADISLGLTLTLPDCQPNFGIHVNGAEADNLGIGLSFVFGLSKIDLTFNFVCYFDFPDMPSISVPLYFKIGLLSIGMGIGVESGMKWFFGGISSPIAENCGYFNGEVLGGIHLVLYDFMDDKAAGRSAGFCFRPIPLVAAVFAFAFQTPEDDGIYISY